jgi:hypothetical protein
MALPIIGEFHVTITEFSLLTGYQLVLLELLAFPSLPLPANTESAQHHSSLCPRFWLGLFGLEELSPMAPWLAPEFSKVWVLLCSKASHLP